VAGLGSSGCRDRIKSLKSSLFALANPGGQAHVGGERLAQKLHALPSTAPAVFGAGLPPGYTYPQYIPYTKDGERR